VYIAIEIYSRILLDDKQMLLQPSERTTLLAVTQGLLGSTSHRLASKVTYRTLEEREGVSRRSISFQ